ncbi:hypothetical protein R3P38DRAFT_1097096 [Favolaschia claudopus]|uniref:F-box domain-containing protein n=1 Tax=Favolaschia claudopus TaxID=2862362 RepID=A0AAW0BDL0_9AGAR
MSRRFNLVSELPFEISSEIFLLCLPTPSSEFRAPTIFCQFSPPIPSPARDQAPLLFLNICKAWSEITLSSPGLWTDIQNFNTSDLRGLERWLARAASRPLSLSTRSGGIARLILRKVTTYQVHYLELYVEHQDSLRFLFEGEPESLPTLRSLTVGQSSSSSRPKFFLHPDDIIRLLHRAPNLTQLTVDNVPVMVLPVFTHPRQIAPPPPVSSNLEYLNLGKHRQFTTGLGAVQSSVLSCLTLPGLQSLNISRLPTSTQILFDFMRRSSPHLRQLCLGQGPLPLHTGEHLFRFPALATLVHLELHRDASFIYPLLTDLSVLPTLVTLVVVDFLHFTSMHSYPYAAVMRALSARRDTCLQSFEMICRRPDVSDTKAIPDSIVSALRELAAESGMRIYIGPRAFNLIDLSGPRDDLGSV